jgi:hypothetical protein
VLAKAFSKSSRKRMLGLVEVMLKVVKSLLCRWS